MVTHLRRSFDVGDEVYIKLTRGLKPGYKLLASTTLNIIKLGSYLIEAHLSDLAYRFKLSSNVKIHPTVFITHLEPKVPNKHNRYESASSSSHDTRQ